MSKIIIFQKPTCSTCREVLKLVKACGRPYLAVNYYETPLSAAQLKGLLRKAGLSAHDVVRSKEDIYKELGLAKKRLSDDELIALMIAHPDLLQRPLVQAGDRVILARPAETVKILL
jgi:arsenate reductase